MERVETKADVKGAIQSARTAGRQIAWVPTLGFLHAGHERQIEAARKLAGTVVVSRFVDPMEFGPNEDFQIYPRDRNHDESVCERLGVGVVFSPSVDEIHPDRHSTLVEETQIAPLLCGISRPNHFRGVATTFLKLFNTIRPDFVVLSEHDWQRTAVIRRVARDLGLDAEIHTTPVVREQDGLAMDSRNVLLKPEQRRDAAAVYDALMAGKNLYDTGNRSVDRIRAEVIHLLRVTRRLHVQYASLVDRDTMREVKEIRSGQTLICCAALIDQIRLIDHVEI